MQLLAAKSPQPPELHSRLCQALVDESRDSHGCVVVDLATLRRAVPVFMAPHVMNPMVKYAPHGSVASPISSLISWVGATMSYATRDRRLCG